MAETMGQRIRALRERLGLSQNDLAKAAGTHPNQVYLIESGRRKALRRENLTRFATALGESEIYLLTGIRPGSDSADWPPLEAYLRQATELDDDQIAHMRRTLEAMEAERELRGIHEQYAAEPPDSPSLHPPGSLGHIFTPAADTGEDLKRAENRRRYDEEQRRKRQAEADDP